MTDARTAINAVERMCRKHNWAALHAELRAMLKFIRHLVIRASCLLSGQQCGAQQRWFGQYTARAMFTIAPTSCT